MTPPLGAEGSPALSLLSDDDAYDRFVGALPPGDVLVVGGAEAGRDALALAARGVTVAYAEVEPVESHPSGSARSTVLWAEVVHRRFPGDRVHYPPAFFAGCWLRMPLATVGLDSLSEAVYRTVDPGGVVTVARGQRFSHEHPPCDHTAAAQLKEDCVFCPPLRFECNRIACLPGAAGVLWGDEDVFVVPDVAPVADGHLLVVTAVHHSCGGACPENLRPAVERARRGIDVLFRKVYERPAVFFEHGPARPRAAGSCVDHAHWHCLPWAAPMRPVIEANGLRGQPVEWATLQAWHDAGRSYVSVEEDGRLWAYEAEELPGQFLRWAAATTTGGEVAVWRWQHLFGEAESRNRFLRTLELLVPAVDAAFAR